MRDTGKDIFTTSEHNSIDSIECVVLGEDNNMQDDVDICEYDSNKLQQNHCLSCMGLAM